MTSSLRNSLHRRNHKERSQLAHRARYGILEKHKDYVLRARDYHSKQDRINRLRQKAADRNKDEFYFGMKNERTLGGLHVKDRGNRALPTDFVKLLKSQDEGYVRTMRTVGLKKIDKLKAQLTAMADLFTSNDLDADDEDENSLDPEELVTLQNASIIPPPATTGRQRRKQGHRTKHVVFVDNEEEARQYAAKPSTQNLVQEDKSKIPSEDLDLGWKTAEQPKNRKQQKDKPDTAASSDIPESEDDHNTPPTRKRLLKELAARLERDIQLRYALRELEMQRMMMGKGGRQKLRGAERVGSDDEDEGDDDDDDFGTKQSRSKSDPKVYKPRVYKWKVERKR